MAQDLGLGITISLRDQFSANSKKVGNSMGRMRKQARNTVDTMKRMQGAMQAAAGAAIFMAGRQAFGAVTDSAIEFGKGIAEVSTLVDTSKVKVEDLSRIAKTASTSFGIDAVQQTAGLYQAISAGVDTSTESLTEFMKVANQVAIGGVTDLNTSVDGLTTVMNAFSKEGLTVQQIADQMFATMKGGKTTISELSRFMFQAAPISAAVGIKFSEVNAAIVALTKQGTPTSVAMTQIRSAIVGLTRPSDDLNKIFAKTKERTAEAFIQAHGFKAALLEINKTAKGTVGGMTKLLGSQEAASGALSILSNNSKFFDEALKSIQNSTGATSEAVDKMQKTHSNRLARMRASLEALKITIGGRLMTALEPLIDRIGAWVNKIDLWLEKHPKVTKAIAGSLGVVAALGVAMGAVAAVMGVISIISVPVLIVFAKVAAVVGLVVAAFIAMKPVLQEIWEENQDVVQSIKSAWDQFSKAIWPIIKFAAKAFIWWQGTILKTVANAFLGIIRIATPVLANIASATRSTVQFMSDAWLVFKTDVLPVFQPIVDAVVTIRDTAVQTFSTIVDWVTNLITKIKEFINQFPIIQKGFEAIKSGVSSTFDFFTAKPLRDFVGEKFSQAKNKLFGGIDQISGRAEQIRNSENQDGFSNTDNAIAFAEQTQNQKLSSTRNPNIGVPPTQITNEINVPPAKIQPADIILDKQKIGKVMFDFQQLQTVRAN